MNDGLIVMFNDKFIITLEQLKKLCLEKTTPDQRMEIQIEVLAKPYREPEDPLIKKVGNGLMKIAERIGEDDKPKKKIGRDPK